MAAAAAAGGRTLGRSSFSRATANPSASSSGAAGVKLGLNGAAFVSSGIPDLDRPMKEPRLFLGTLPAPVSSSKEDRRHRAMGVGGSSDGRPSDEGLRIAWQYRKYFGDEKTSHAEPRDNKQEFSNDFDLRKPLEKNILNGQHVECDWEMVSFIRSLKAMVRSSNAVAVITFPNTVLSDSFYEDKDLAKLLTGYQDMVPVILEASTLSLKLRKRRSLVLERLNQAPVDGSSGPSNAASGSCSSSSQGSQLDF
ncbi:hypothetical protein PR202_ga14857 [Eleusine coracana subsp. coracana]|uniref:Uncharacterized protein n=1 Tax=Eleusine coracana subsp. coracana TaxID=191504 RepID=A0AAV5CIU0_ELECO|nr:hypothetical protein PR202_ga14857 [Eleusine coracana subsp. coracana]